MPASSTARPPRSGSRAAQAPAPRAAAAARSVTLCGKERLPRQRHALVDGKGAVVGGHEDPSPRGRVLREPVGDLRLAVRVDAARWLVEDEEVGLAPGDRGETPAPALASREVTRRPL